MHISYQAVVSAAVAVVWSSICVVGVDAFRTTAAVAFHGVSPVVGRTATGAADSTGTVSRDYPFGISTAAAGRDTSTGNAFVPRPTRTCTPALFAAADGDDGVEVIIGNPVDGNSDTLEVDADNVVVHPPNGEASSPEAAKGETKQKEEAEGEESLVLEPVPPPSHSVEQDHSGPDGGKVTTLTVNLGAPGHPDPIVIQTGKVGRQAAGAITLTRGDTVLLATAARDDKPKESIDFLPLSVEHQERFSSAGLTSGSYNKRDGRVSVIYDSFI